MRLWAWAVQDSYLQHASFTAMDPTLMFIKAQLPPTPTELLQTGSKAGLAVGDTMKSLTQVFCPHKKKCSPDDVIHHLCNVLLGFAVRNPPTVASHRKETLQLPPATLQLKPG